MWIMASIPCQHLAPGLGMTLGATPVFAQALLRWALTLWIVRHLSSGPV